jgi:hypothetical protein
MKERPKRMISRTIPALMAVSLIIVSALGMSSTAHAQQAVSVSVSVKDHRFEPAEVKAPANKPIMLHVRNLDSTAMEFESVTLRVEKVVAAKSEGVVRLRPLAPGRYKFFDDFNQSATGVLVVE